MHTSLLVRAAGGNSCCVQISLDHHSSRKGIRFIWRLRPDTRETFVLGNGFSASDLFAPDMGTINTVSSSEIIFFKSCLFRYWKNRYSFFPYLAVSYSMQGECAGFPKGSLKESATILHFCVHRTDMLDSRLHRDFQSHGSQTSKSTTNLLLYICLEVNFLACAVFSWAIFKVKF